MLLRTRIFKPFDYWVDVKDWAANWTGTVVFTQSGHDKVVTAHPDPLEPSTTTTSAKYDITATTTLGAVALEVPLIPGIHDEDFIRFDVTTAATASQAYHWDVQQTVPCDTEGCTEPPHIEQSTYDDSVIGDQPVDTVKYVVLQLRPDGSYTLELSFPAPEMNGTWGSTTPVKSEGGTLQTGTFQVHLVLEIAGEGPNPTTLSGSVSKPVVRTISPLHTGGRGDPMPITTTETLTWKFVKQ